MSDLEKISIQIHPRAFSAFGEDLVTNDLVAITELVKNSYDAFALTVKIIFGKDKKGEEYIQIIDDGFGMDKHIIMSAWATIATPYKKKNPTVKRIINNIEFIRRVSGNKGLGRFSAARLGDEMHMITKASNDRCLNAFFDWKAFESNDDISNCYMTLEYIKNNPFKELDCTGTIITIKKLKENWNQSKIEKLSYELSRLISPFENINNFSIEILSDNCNQVIEVKPHNFINDPIYKICGIVTKLGVIKWKYRFDNGKNIRTNGGKIDWDIENYDDEYIKLPEYSCGYFSFEIRAWDLDSDSIEDVSERFDIGKKEIRQCIKLYKGISVYRDNILVLPKSEASRDWLGLDTRRISQIGRRLSTSQIVGIVNISNEKNPGIKDTTDREKLVDTKEYNQFINILNCIVETFQSERLKDRVDNKKKASLTEIVAPLSVKPLVNEIENAILIGKSSNDILSYIKNYEKENEKQLEDLNERLVYYAQTASLGSVAIVIMHEILTGMTIIKRFIQKVSNYYESFDDKTKEYFDDALKSHKRILDVTKSFSPLYKRDLRKKENQCNLILVLENSIRLIKGKKVSKNIEFRYNLDKDITVLMNEGELLTVFINLFDNACYWIEAAKNEEKVIEITVEDYFPNEGRVTIIVSDTGCGIQEEDIEKIFVPGVTSKPKGIGMGLVIVTELISSYKGRIGVRIPGNLSGATFVFDIPIRKGSL